jgi:predicted Zn finger-like uncharacterized protein
MQIVCPNCSTTYQLAATAVGPEGRTVRCVRCQHVWFVPAPGVMPAVAADEPIAEALPEPDAGLPSHEHLEAAPPDAAASEFTAGAGLPPGDYAGSPEPADTSLDEAAQWRAVALSDVPIPVTEAPPLAPEPGDGISRADGPGRAIDNDAQGIEHAAERRRARAAARRKSRRMRMPLPVIIVLLLFVCGALLGLRKDIVRHVPQMGSFYAAIGMPVNLRGLVFHDVKISNETHDGVPVLVVEGVIASTVGVPVDVPRIRFALRNAAGAEVYTWTAQPPQPVLEPGDAMPFRSRLASPPADGQDLQVRFFTRRDAAAGAR